ncbi:Glutamine--fructose-6-phosphate aminotransferase [isomerizing] [Gordonia sp. MP11Mi]|uniref:Glutamine--fructose-6-phosphate aminotransferase [isomerizing] n=2 Tax=Gordonia sp. MP11Mi TaxID=3022769 RepID=A0AA97GTK0_9ACTN
MAVNDQHPGHLMAAEIAEQPNAWRDLLAARAACVEIGELIASRAPRFVQFVARGTSDHAALYAKYLVEIGLQIPAGMVSPSAVTVYGARPDLRDVLLIAVSQSGGSPDLVKSVEVGRAHGALTLAVTNNESSPLSDAAELHVDVMAGAEKSVAATKSYTSELLALYLVIAAWQGVSTSAADALPDLGDQVLGSDGALAAAAQKYRYAQRLLTTGRGYSYPTAREAALKLMETSYLTAQAFSGADLLHGPLATVDPQVPVLAVVPTGRGGDAMAPVIERLVERGADIFGVGAASAITGLTGGVAIPDAPEELSPLLEIVPFQLMALHLSLARGENPDTPRGLRKVTETL